MTKSVTSSASSAPSISVSLITDRETGRPRGFGFVEMSSGADEAIQALHQKDMGGRTLNVNEARPRTDRPRRQGW